MEKMVCVILSAVLFVCGCGQRRVQLNSGGSELVKIENIDDKINRLSEIVSTPTICTVKITELPIWSVLFKAGAIYAVWKVCGKYLADKLEGWVKRILECDAVYRPRYQELKPYVEKEALFEHKAVKPPIIDDDID